MKEKDYKFILVESFYPADMSGRHGPVHIRPLPDQEPYSQSMFVECSKKLSEDYPVGTVFRIKAKIKTTDNETSHIYCHYSWKYEVVETPK